MDHNTAMGTIKKLKKIVRICVANEWIDKDPFMSFKVKIRETNRPYLLQDELDKIIALKFSAERLATVRDIFVFCCYTGLAYADVQKLRRVDIVNGHDGEKWIHTERVKTETATRVPLLPQALKIMDAYKDHPQCVNEGKLLPVSSNQKMNEYLKEIADRCEINKKMTFHTARHTFATTVTLTNGMSLYYGVLPQLLRYHLIFEMKFNDLFLKLVNIGSRSTVWNSANGFHYGFDILRFYKYFFTSVI